MEKVFVGKIVNTHGIKGEMRIISDFERKDLVFKVGKSIIISSLPHIITSYRVHKEFDMISIEGYDNINQVIPFKGQNVYVEREDLELAESDYLLADLIDMFVIMNDKIIGSIIDYTTGLNPLLVVMHEEKQFYIPMNGDFITNVDVKNNKVFVSDSVRGLMNEN